VRGGWREGWVADNGGGEGRGERVRRRSRENGERQTARWLVRTARAHTRTHTHTRTQMCGAPDAAAPPRAADCVAPTLSCFCFSNRRAFPPCKILIRLEGVGDWERERVAVLVEEAG